MAPNYIATVHFLRCIKKKRARKSYHAGCGTFTLAGYDILQCVFLHVLDIATILLLLDPLNLIVNLDRVARPCYLIMLYDRTQLIGTTVASKPRYDLSLSCVGAVDTIEDYRKVTSYRVLFHFTK